jgi:DnaK suppressor protein
MIDMTKSKKKYLKKELEEFKKMLIELRAELLKDVEGMSSDVLHRKREDASTNDISGFADLGTENFEQEIKLELIESEQEELAQIEEALGRIQTGAYGACLNEDCHGLIRKVRLRAVPFATLCIDCQTKEEEGY